MTEVQPKPTKGETNVTPWAKGEFKRVIDAQEQRGIAKYGTTLQTFNGRDPIQDAKQELVDAWQYLCQIELERANRKESGSMLGTEDCTWLWAEILHYNPESGMLLLDTGPGGITLGTAFANPQIYNIHVVVTLAQPRREQSW